MDVGSAIDLQFCVQGELRPAFRTSNSVGLQRPHLREAGVPEAALARMRHQIRQASDLGHAGRVVDGFVILLSALDEARAAESDGEFWTRELAREYQISVDHFVEKFARPSSH